MTLTEKKIEKILDYWKKRIPIEAIATLLKISRNTVKKYLRERLGYSYQSYRYPSHMSSQQRGALSWDDSTGIDQQYRTLESYGNPIDVAPLDQIPHNVFEQLLGVIEENKTQKQTITKQAEELQTAYQQVNSLTLELDKEKQENETKNKDIEKLEQAGVDQLFTPGATTKEIVEYINQKFSNG